MANITLTLGTLTKTRTINNGDLNRLVNALKHRYRRLAPQGGQFTDQQVFDLFEADFIKNLMSVTTSEEHAKAAETITAPAIT